jgi:zinc protease
LFEEKEIEAEREVVIEEIKKNSDDPGRQSSRLLFETVYQSHPYSIPVIGYSEVIKKVPRKKILEYFQSRYVPSNMTLVVAGDFDESQLKLQIKERFENFELSKLKKVVRSKDKKQSKPRLSLKKCTFEEAFLNIAWKIPQPDHADIPAIEILGLILGQGDSSRLVKAARIDQALVNSVGAGTYTPADGGFFVVSSSLNEKKLKPYLEVVSKSLKDILENPPSGDEIQKCITNFESDEFYSLETVDELARKAGHYDNLMGDPAYFKKFMKRVQAVKPADIVKAARKYFSPKEMTVTMMSNTKDVDSKKILNQWIKEYTDLYKKSSKVKVTSRALKVKKKKLSWAGDSRSSGRTEKIVLSSGVTVLLRPSYETPTISARAALCGGTRVEPENKDGLVELLSNSWLTGTKTLREEDIHNKTEAIASSVSAFGGRNTLGLSLETLSPFEDEALDLFNDTLAAPTFPEIPMEREKTLMLEAVKSKEDYPSSIASQQFFEGLFDKHPYAKELSGKLTTIPSLKSSDVTDYWKNVARTRNLTVAISGHFNADKWKKSLEGVGKQWNQGQRIEKTFAHESPKKATVLFKKLEKEQTHIIYGFKGLTQTDPSRFTLQLVQSVLSGLGGRLFMELREKASLAYSVSPIRMEGIDTGYFGAYIACSPDKVNKAVLMLREEFDKLTESLVSASELDRAKRFVVGRHDIELQKNSSICAAMLFDDIYGNPYDESFHFSELVEDITAKDLRDLATRIFKQHPVLSVVGPAAPTVDVV